MLIIRLPLRSSASVHLGPKNDRRPFLTLLEYSDVSRGPVAKICSDRLGWRKTAFQLSSLKEDRLVTQRFDSAEMMANKQDRPSAAATSRILPRHFF